MAFLVEDGSGLEGATAFISVAYFNTHFTDRGKADSIENYDTDVIQAGIIKSTDYIAKRFGKKFRGSRQAQSQGLPWPRLGAIDNDGYVFDAVPPQIQKACAEYALIAIQLVDLTPIPAFQTPVLDATTGTVSGGTGTAVIRDRSKVGPVEEEKWYSDPGQSKKTSERTTQSSLVSNSSIPEYPVADLWIAETLRSTFSYRLGRA